MRNLEHDKDVIRQLLAVTPMDIPPMFSEIAALHAIERAIAAESKVEEMQKALEISKEILRELYFQVGQDMDINPSAKTAYLSKIAYANNNLKGVPNDLC